MADCGGKKPVEKGVAQQLEAIRDVLKNCCCGLLCKLKKIRGTCISVSEYANSLESPCPIVKLTIDEDEVAITKIHASFLELEIPPSLIDFAIITVKDREGNIVWQDGFGDDITNLGIERYETTFVHPLLVKGPVCVELAFFAPLSGGFHPVNKLGSLTVVYCKECNN